MKIIISLILLCVTNLSALLPVHSENQLASIESFDNPSLYIGAKTADAGIYSAQSETDKEYTTFRIIPGLANRDCVSFESALLPNFYLRHQDGLIRLQGREKDNLFADDATFRKTSGLANPLDPSLVSFESVNFPGRYICHRDSKLFIDPDNMSAAFKQNATWKIKPPNWSGTNPKAKLDLKQKPLVISKGTINLLILLALGSAAIALSVFFTISRDKKKKEYTQIP
jgi:hypothetical protein